jgi:protease II
MKTKRLHALYKQRNWTKKSYREFKDNLSLYLTPDELKQVGSTGVNQLEPYLHEVNQNMRSRKLIDSLLRLNHRPNMAAVRKLASEIPDALGERKVYSEDDTGVVWTQRGKTTGYEQLTTHTQCKERALLDLDELGRRFPFFEVSTIEFSPSGNKVLFTVDFVGSQVYHLFIKDLYSHDVYEVALPRQRMTPTHDVLSGSTGLSGDTNSTQEVMWLSDDEVAYVSLNRYYNDSGVYSFNLTTKRHKRLFRAPHGVFVSLNGVTSGLCYVLILSDYNSDELYLMDSETYKVVSLRARRPDVRYPYVDHAQGLWYLQRQEKNVDLIQTTKDWRQFTTLYRNTNPYEQITDILVGDDHATAMFVLTQVRSTKVYLLTMCGGGVLRLVLESPTDSFKLDRWSRGTYYVTQNKYMSPPVQHAIPQENTKSFKIIKKMMKCAYQERVVFVHPRLKITLIYKEQKTNMKCLLRGYGAYNTAEVADYSPFYVPLLERGFLVAIAHLRGGGEYGYWGYDQGRMKHKMNSFTDFIETADYLVRSGWTTHDKLAIWGRSCGGLLVSSVLNQRPDLCKVALVGVPFVTPLETMGSYKTPLGVETRTELGDPADPSTRRYLHRYAPLEHLQPDGRYPNMFIYTNLNDTLVPYKEPLQYYRALKTQVNVYKNKERDLSFYLDTRFGHKQGTHLRDRREHYGMLFAYLLNHLND